MKTSSRSSKRKSKSSQKRSKKKTRSNREKIKKLKQRDDSVSFSDEHLLSTSSVSVSCSSSEDDHKSRNRGRSRDRRKRRKDKKKKSKRSSLVSESCDDDDDDDDDDSRVKKSKKSSNKSRGSDSRKKRHVKRRRRDRSVSVTSSSSRSRSFSASKLSDDNEREPERKEEKVESKERKGRGKVESKERKGREKVVLKKRKEREKGKERGVSKRSRHRSRSCSTCSVHSENSSYFSEEKVLEKNNATRLKSVIVVTKESEVVEEQESNREDRHEDEIVCDYDEYPSKSNDSNDGVSGREAVLYPHEFSSEKIPLDEPNKTSVSSDVRRLEIPKIPRQAVEGIGGITPSYVWSKVDDPSVENRTEGCTANASSSHYDLEAILRQKALENLLKRQSKVSAKMPDDTNSHHNIEVKARPDNQRMSHDMEKIRSVQKVGKVDDARFNTSLAGLFVDSGPSEDNDSHLPSVKVETAHPEDNDMARVDLVNSRPNVNLSMSRKEFLGAKNTWKRQLIAPESFQKNLSSSREMTVKDSKQQLIAQEYSQPNNSSPLETSNKDFTRSSASSQFDSKGSTEKVDAVVVSDASASVEPSANDETNKGEEEAQFQQKTMSVMRGGEMVQVSYKVYIPKKAPALARRQLKR